MIADYAFYTGTYLGDTIPSDKYNFFGERASDKLARYEAIMPKTESAQTTLKKCACAIADILYENKQSTKNGQGVSSESVQGYYTVSYSVVDEETLKKKINNVIGDYLGGYITRVVRVVY